ncbi:MAG: ATP-binding cassette domain-containing protein [Opitutales bacterium]|nr:ATP-binding cassette domain-containing protein [Opitutales bacterium]
MLVAEELSVYTRTGQKLVGPVSLGFAEGKMHALIGPSGCGKSTLLKGIMHLLPNEGQVSLRGEKIASTEDLVGHLGFVPQFSIAQPQLTVEQNIRFARKLFAPETFREEKYHHLLDVIGLTAHLDKRVSQLSGGQLRRLGLALELINNPPFLFCDEVTTGLDPASEQEILEVLRLLAEEGVTIVCVIHNLAQLQSFDQIHLLSEGQLVFQGPLETLKKHFQIEDATKVYTALKTVRERHLEPLPETEKPPRSHAHPQQPGLFKQWLTLIQRRFILFYQDRGYLGLTLALTFGFPFLVVIFAWNGLPAFEALAIVQDGDFISRLQSQIDFQKEAMRTGSLVSGLIMFQVILLTLMGANNGAREIAGERVLFEKEKLSGLKPLAYLGSKVVFFLFISILQGVWMTFFVKYICGFPGPFLPQALILTLTVFSMTLISLALSSISGSGEKASLMSTYIVGFQLPLSGVVLALPEVLVWVFRPFIAAYWGWSGYLDTFRSNRFYDAVELTVDTNVMATFICLIILCIHSLLALAVVAVGVYQNRFAR